MFKVSNELSGQLVSEGFHFGENHHNLIHQSGTRFKVDQVNTETYGKKFAPYQGPRTWNSIRQEKKSITTLAAFKTKIKCWKPICSCRICRIFIQRIGFV